MITKVLKFVSAIFALIWMVIIFSEYWRYNPNYSKAIELFQYYDLLIIFIAIGAAFTWFLKKPRQKPLKYFNGLSIFLVLLFLDIIAVNRFTNKEPGLNFTSDGITSHLGHVMGVAICLFLVYLLVRVMGGIFTSIFPLKVSKGDLPLIQVATGIVLFTFFLFLLGAIGILSPFIIIPIGLIILAVYWRHTFHVVKSTLWTPIDIPKSLNVVGIFSFFFLAIFLIMNFGQILRPFPIGSDSLRIYGNLPNLIADYGALVDGYQPYNWSLFMSSGLLVFGRMDVVLGISFLGGLLSLFALFQLSKKWLDVNYSALVLILFYTLPMVSFLSYMDMKVDMGLLFYSLATLLVYYNWVSPSSDDVNVTKGFGLSKAKSFFKKRLPSVLKQNRLLVVIGLLCGFALGIKLTALFFVLALFSTVWFFKGNPLTFIASFCLCFGVVFLLKLDDQPVLRQFHQNVSLLQWSLLGIGVALMGYLFSKQKNKLMELLKYSMIIGAFFTLPILPWLGKNLIETGEVSVFSLLNGKKAFSKIKLDKATSAEVAIPDLYQLPETAAEDAASDNIEEQSKENKKDKNNRNKEKNKEKRKNKQKEVERQKNKEKKKFVMSGVSEDLHRFMGYEVVPARYLSLPYDVFIKTNIPNFFIDVGFVLLLLFPILFLFPGRNHLDWKSNLSKIGFMLLSFLFLLISIPSAFLNQKKFTTSSEGLAFLEANSTSGFLGEISDRTNAVLLFAYSPINEWFLSITPSGSSITYPLMIALFLLILGMVYLRTREHTKTTQSIILFVLMYFFLWWILGAGASWYGITLFCLPFIFLFRSISTDKKEEEVNSKWNVLSGPTLKKGVVLSIAMVWMFLAFTQRAANYNPANKETATRLYFSPIMKYSMGELKVNRLMDYHFPSVRKIVDIVNKDKKSLIYMVGTPSSYFINKNDSRVLSDTFLDFFDRLMQQHKTKDKIIDRLKAEGIKYIIFDLKMNSYDVTPEKTLTKKFTQFLNTLYANPKVELLATDRRIQLNSTGEEIFGVFSDKGPIVKFGNIAIFKIK